MHGLKSKLNKSPNLEEARFWVIIGRVTCMRLIIAGILVGTDLLSCQTTGYLPRWVCRVMLLQASH
jgi:hypothetical protein